MSKLSVFVRENRLAVYSTLFVLGAIMVLSNVNFWLIAGVALLVFAYMELNQEGLAGSILSWLKALLDKLRGK